MPRPSGKPARHQWAESPRPGTHRSEFSSAWRSRRLGPGLSAQGTSSHAIHLVQARIQTTGPLKEEAGFPHRTHRAQPLHLVQAWIQTTSPWGRPLCQILGNSCPAGAQPPSREAHGRTTSGYSGRLHRGRCCEQGLGPRLLQEPWWGRGDIQPDRPPGDRPADWFLVDRAGEATRIQDVRAASPSSGQQPDTSHRSSACTEGRGDRRDQRPTEAQPQALGPRLTSQYRLSRHCRNVHGRLWMGGAAPRTGRKDHSLGAWEASSVYCRGLFILFAVSLSL